MHYYLLNLYLRVVGGRVGLLVFGLRVVGKPFGLLVVGLRVSIDVIG